jgi:hypothetical protein
LIRGQAEQLRRHWIGVENGSVRSVRHHADLKILKEVTEFLFTLL